MWGTGLPIAACQGQLRPGYLDGRCYSWMGLFRFLVGGHRKEMLVRWALIRRSGFAASVAVLVPLAAGAVAAPVSGWRTVDVTARQGRFNAVTAADPRHAWAVGGSPDRSGDFAPLIARWNGVSWAPARVPAKVRSVLGPLALLGTAVAAGPRSLWAFSITIGGWLHYDGSSWTGGLIPGVLTTTASAVAARKSIWAFGLRDTFHNPAPFSAYATNVNGKVTWTKKAVPGDAVIYGASAVSGSDLWAAATSGLFTGPIGSPSGTASSATSKTATVTSSLLHYHAGRWHKAMPLPAAMRANPATAIFARRDTDIWVGGAVNNASAGTTAAIAHWNGRNWTLIKLPAPAPKADYRTEAITADGTGNLWALADCAGTHCPHHGLTSRLWHEHAGHWTGPMHPALTRHPAVLLSLAAAGRSVWAAGTVTLGPLNFRGLIAARTTNGPPRQPA
jgi:hypothetical protein